MANSKNPIEYDKTFPCLTRVNICTWLLWASIAGQQTSDRGIVSIFVSLFSKIPLQKRSLEWKYKERKNGILIILYISQISLEICITILTFTSVCPCSVQRTSVTLSDFQFLQLYHKVWPIKVALYKLRVWNMHFGSP